MVIISAAGMAAHLGGVLAAHTPLPVIGVPIKSGALKGVDALYSTVMMPPGIPVAIVAIDGARNAGILAAQIIGIANPDVRAKIIALKEKNGPGRSGQEQFTGGNRCRRLPGSKRKKERQEVNLLKIIISPL